MNTNLINDETKGLILVSSSNNQVSADLRTKFNVLLDAVAKADKATWQFAKGMHDILTDELWKGAGCNSENEFAEKFGFSQPMFPRYKYGVDNLKVLKKLGITESDITLSKCYYMSTLGDNQEAFLNYLIITYKVYVKEEDIPKSGGTLFKRLGEKALTTYIKEFKQYLKEIMNEGKEKKAEEKKPEDNQPEDNQPEDNQPEEIYIEIEHDGKKYRIPENVLSQYEVTE